MVGLAHATLTYVSDLRAAGVPERQAQIQAEFITDIIESNLATQTDIEKLRTELKTDIEKLRAELKADIEKLRAELKADIENVRLEIEKVRQESHVIKAELKVDIEKLRMESKSDREKIKDELLLKIAETKNDMIRWYMGSIVALSAILITAIKFVH